MNVKVTDDFVFVQTPYGQNRYVESILNGVWSKKENMFRFPKNLHVMRELIRSYPDLKSVPQFMEAGYKLKSKRDAALLLKSMKDVPQDDSRLRPYQRTDIRYLETLQSAGIFNEPRTGKTPLSILLMKRLGTKRNLIIAPASLIWNWESEIRNWLPEARVWVVNGTPKKRETIYRDFKIYDNIKAFNAQHVGLGGPEPERQRVLIISKDTWKSDFHHFEKYTFDTCFVDEAHFLRNSKTAQSKAVYAINAKRKYALTGTPSVKHAADVFGILHFLHPKKFNSYWQFCDRYFSIGEDFMGHKVIGDVKENRREELEDLIAFMSVQRKRKDVMQWLPDKQYQTIPVKMEGKQEKLYERMRDEFLAYLEDTEHEVDTSGILPQTMRMRQICLDPRLLGFEVVGAKTKAILEWLEDNQEPVVIMSMFTSYLKLLKDEIEKLGLKVGMIHGEMDNREKSQSALQFQTGATDVLLCNIISAGTGFTLDKAETILFTDKAWNPTDNEQAEDRITPVTEDRNHKHSIISFTCKDSYEEHINRLLSDKKTITDVINNGGVSALKRLLM